MQPPEHFWASWVATRLQIPEIYQSRQRATLLFFTQGGPLESLLDPVQSEWIVWPIFLVIAFKLLKHPKAFSLFWGYASSKPAAGFLLAGIIIAYVFADVFGSTQFWQASLGAGFHPETPDIVESYLQLLACYFIFISSIGFCIPVTKRQKNTASL